MTVIKNATEKPRVFYGLHMVAGVAEYPEHKDSSGKPTRILVAENAAKQMDPTFAGLPVYVHHVEDVDFSKMEQEADGYVVESFYNALDGKHWAKFIVVTDKGHEAIRKGWKLSNAYAIKNVRGGGKWHAVDYSQEVDRGEYLHLAIVPNPRYQESIVFTPEQFKAYNEAKELELKTLKNSKPQEKKSMFKWFKREEVKNSADLEGVEVQLKSGSTRTLAQLVNEAEKAEEEKKNMDADKDKPVMANGDHKVKVGEEEMTVNELVAKYNEFMEEKKKAANPATKENEKVEDKKEDDKKSNASPAKVETPNFDALKNASPQDDATKVETSADKTARGKSRYGSAS